MCYVWGEMNHGMERLAMLMSRVTIAIPSLCAKAETNLRCAAVLSTAAGECRKKKNRADRIRTCDLFVPNEARYQPALQLAIKAGGIIHVILPLASTNLYICRKYGIKSTAWAGAMRCSVGGNYP